jgi:hypothetical protein
VNANAVSDGKWIFVALLLLLLNQIDNAVHISPLVAKS